MCYLGSSTNFSISMTSSLKDFLASRRADSNCSKKSESERAIRMPCKILKTDELGWQQCKADWLTHSITLFWGQSTITDETLIKSDKQRRSWSCDRLQSSLQFEQHDLMSIRPGVDVYQLIKAGTEISWSVRTGQKLDFAACLLWCILSPSPLLHELLWSSQGIQSGQPLPATSH